MGGGTSEPTIVIFYEGEERLRITKPKAKLTLPQLFQDIKPSLEIPDDIDHYIFQDQYGSIIDKLPENMSSELQLSLHVLRSFKN